MNKHQKFRLGSIVSGMARADIDMAGEELHKAAQAEREGEDLRFSGHLGRSKSFASKAAANLRYSNSLFGTR
jgi:hypothetical protein